MNKELNTYWLVFFAIVIPAVIALVLGNLSLGDDPSGISFLGTVVLGGGIIFGLLLLIAVSTAAKGITEKQSERGKSNPATEAVAAIVAALVIIGVGIWATGEFQYGIMLNLAILSLALGLLRGYAFIGRKNNWPLLTSDRDQSIVATLFVAIFVLTVFV